MLKKKYFALIHQILLLKDSIRLIVEANSVLFFSLLMTVTVSSVLPIVAIHNTALIINTLVAQPRDITAIGYYLMMWVLLLFLHQLASPIIAFLQSNLADKTVFIINQSIIAKSNRLHSLAHFESPDFHNDLHIIGSQSYTRPINLVVTLFGLLGDFSLIFYSILLLYLKISFFSVVVFFCILLQTHIMSKIQVKVWMESLGRSLRSRMMNYISALSINPSYAKEMRLFPLGQYLYLRYQRLFREIYTSMFRLRLKLLFWPIAPSIMLLIANYLALYQTVLRISEGTLEVGIIVVVIQLFMQLHQTVLRFGEQAGWLSGHLLFFEKYFAFLSRKENSFFDQKKKGLLIKDETIYSVRFENVSFVYPDGRVALTDINFELKDTEKLAIVGSNGSGKTTLIKLICGFYAPTAGYIFINEIPIECYDLVKLRALIAPVFQDFGAYALSVKENITMGSVRIDDDQLRREIADVGAEFIFSLPEQLENTLGKPFGGTDLSLGQWQKLALLRAIHKKGSLLILDEPTASLDPISEREIFEQFASLCQGKPTILVTHRLNSITIADRVLLLEAGTQVGFGVHDQLLRCNQRYKEMFYSQGSPYIDLLAPTVNRVL